MRNIITVAQEVHDLLPIEQDELKRSLLCLMNDCAYTAPEMMYQRWCQFAELLNAYLGQDMEEQYKVDIQKVFNGHDSSK